MQIMKASVYFSNSFVVLDLHKFYLAFLIQFLDLFQFLGISEQFTESVLGLFPFCMRWLIENRWELIGHPECEACAHAKLDYTPLARAKG